MDETERLEARLLDGPCPYTCIDLSFQRCGCGEHALSSKRIDVVHYDNLHWRAACAFDAVLDKSVRRIKQEATDSLRDRMIEVVEQKRDEWYDNQRVFGANNASAHVKWGTMSGAAHEIITALKAVGRKGEGK